LNESTATRYQRLRRQAHVISLATGITWLACVGLTPLAVVMADGAAAVTAAWPDPWRPLATVGVFVTAIALVWEAVALPITWQAAVRAEQLRRRRADVGALVKAQLRDAALGVAFVVGAAAAVVVAVSAVGDRWWMMVGVATLPLSLAAGSLAAVALRQSSRLGVSRPDVAAALEQLTQHATGRTVAIHEVEEADDLVPTAAVTGLGTRGSILLSRSMVRDWPAAEIAVIVAHEMAHHVRRDLWRKAALDAAVAIVALWVSAQVVPIVGGPGVDGPIDVASLPLLALVVWSVWLLLRPVRLAQSRSHERAADRWAVRVTGAPAAMRAAIRRMESRHLAEERPSPWTRWFFHRHPTVAERLNAIGE
jgi:Zn-dependent protease with chaperone function